MLATRIDDSITLVVAEHLEEGLRVAECFSSERNSTRIFPLPMEVLRLVDTLRPSDGAQSGTRAA
ncbi:hypothetical protein [Streptomyces capitiformicae]|uniref:hypothetical protein n=1 Tax=Streptomyces capitiformicae TaxID=2014920 RepID=UPI00167A5A58|nr:hypothetical protein [Streptomyces capitiformicae]